MVENMQGSGPLLQMIGTIMSAIGSTPSKVINNETANHLDLWGNVLQALGTAIQVDEQEEINLEKYGNEIQAFGNVFEIAGSLLPLKNETKQQLEIKGNWMQAFGALLAVIDEIQDQPSYNKIMNLNGNVLSSVGNSYQAIGGMKQLSGNEEKAQILEVQGSWIQVVGSVLSFLAQNNDNTKKSKIKASDGLYPNNGFFKQKDKK